MKTKIIFPILFLFAAATAFAQECSTFFPFKKGASLEFTHYDQKDRVTSTTMQKVSVIEDKGAEGLQAEIEAKVNDDKDKEVMNSTYKVICKDNILYMDLTMMMPQLTESISSMDVTMTGDDLQLPAKLTAGQALPDATMQIKAGSGGMNIISMTIEIVDRKVEGKETIETPAGTFDCFKIRQTTKTKMLVGKTFESVEWYAEGVGMVKSETYDKKGRVDSYTLLTKFSEE